MPVKQSDDKFYSAFKVITVYLNYSYTPVLILFTADTVYFLQTLSQKCSVSVAKSLFKIEFDIKKDVKMG